MSLKHLLLAGLLGVTGCQNPTGNQPLCSWLDGVEANYPCVADVPLLPDVPPPAIHPPVDDDR